MIVNLPMPSTIAADDLRPGQTRTVHGQGMGITPTTRTVTINWIGPDDVHYSLDGDRKLRVTTLARFLDIINGR